MAPGALPSAVVPLERPAGEHALLHISADPGAVRAQDIRLALRRRSVCFERYLALCRSDRGDRSHTDVVERLRERGGSNDAADHSGIAAAQRLRAYTAPPGSKGATFLFRRGDKPLARRRERDLRLSYMDARPGGASDSGALRARGACEREPADHDRR